MQHNTPPPTAEPAAEPPLLLAFETATPVFSVAVCQGPVVLALQEVYADRQHARLVTAAAQQLLDNLDLRPAQLAAVATSAGPGSYTGLRVGTAAAKGLCHALGIPLLAVGTLATTAALAQPLAVQLQARIVAMLDARRMEVYAQVFGPALDPRGDAAPVVLDADSFADVLAEGPTLFVGEGAAKFAPLVAAHPNAYVLPGIQASAKGMAAWAYTAYVEGRFADVVAFEPDYLKPPGTTPPRQP